MRNAMRMGTRIATNLSLPKELVDELDEVAGKRNRSAYVEALLEKQLRRERMRRAWEAARGILKDHPDFPTSEAVVEWVRARRAEKTYSGPEDSG
jgi:metal-responsive CopG/Arc/MetJ family transcriptional regulator